MKKLLFIFFIVSLMQCQYVAYVNLVPGDTEEEKRKKKRDDALECIMQTALCVYGPTLSDEKTPERRYRICSNLSTLQVSRPCLGWDGM